MSPSKQGRVDERLQEKSNSQGGKNVRPNKKDNAAKSLTQSEIHIDPNYERLVPRPTTEEYEALKESITREGQRDSIIVNNEGIILDGHTRFKICKEIGREIIFQIRSFPDIQAEENFVFESAVIRRNLNLFQKIELLQPAFALEQGRASERERSGLRTRASSDARVGKAAAIVAKKFGVSVATLERGRYVLKHATPKQISELQRGEATINGVYNEIRRKEKTARNEQATSRTDPAQEKENGRDEALQYKEKQEERGEASLDREVECDGCHISTTRAKLKELKLCENCRRRLSMNW